MIRYDLRRVGKSALSVSQLRRNFVKLGDKVPINFIKGKFHD